MLARMFANENCSLLPSVTDSDGAYLIDRSPKYFEPILNYLRTGSLIIDPNVNPEGVLEEAKYFGIDTIIPRLEAMAKSTILPRFEHSQGIIFPINDNIQGRASADKTGRGGCVDRHHHQ